MFKRKLLNALTIYNHHQYSRDLMPGVIPGIVALPLAIAFIIDSDVSPDKRSLTPDRDSVYYFPNTGSQFKPFDQFCKTIQYKKPINSIALNTFHS